MIHITIVGLKANQARAVERQFAGIVQFTFIPADRSDTRLPSGADWAIIARFAAHRWSTAAFGHLPRRQVVFCAGGGVSIRRHVVHAVEVLTSPRRVA